MNSQAANQKFETQPGTGGMAGPSFDLPPTFPPGVNPETYRLEEVTHLLKQAAYFPIFSIPNPRSKNTAFHLLRIPFLITGLLVNEELHHFETKVNVPTLESGLQASDHVGETVAHVNIHWYPIPWNFEASPDRKPPTTVLNPLPLIVPKLWPEQQRFTMMNGHFKFVDKNQSGFRGFGAGRTFPVREGGKPRLRIGAVIDILEGLGTFSGLTGTAVVNGWIAPPNDLALNIMVRLMDPTGKLKSDSEFSPLKEVPNPDPNAIFMFFLGETDPDRPVKLNFAPDGRILGSTVHELLRLVQIGYGVNLPDGIGSRTEEGPIVGSVSATLHFNPLDPRPVSPIQTTNGVFTFFDQDKKVIGTIKSNIVEGRAFRTELEGAPMPVFRMGGFGPIIEGAGQLSGADGLMSMNSVVSVFPRTLSNLYVLRLYDPEGKFHKVLRNLGA